MKKKQFICAILIMMTFGLLPRADGQSMLERLKQKALDRASQAKPANTPTPAAASAASPAPATADSSSASAASQPAAAAEPPIQAYQNYDFVPGESIIFADDFTTTQDGEFPNQWELISGQGAVNQQKGFETFTLSSGNYVRVNPRVKAKDYLGKSYTVEFDTYTASGGEIIVMLEQGGQEASISTGKDSMGYHAEGVGLSGDLPNPISGSNYESRWHHIAVAVKNNQLKVYVDQYRVLVVPDMKFSAASLQFAGVADPDHPIIFTNVRVASGGGMNLIGKKFTDAKIVTHGINFDIDKATLRPESMGVLNQIKSIMAGDATLTFEIDGHTDNTGAAAHNQQLSEQRAAAVKAQLVTMGIDASRFTTKGYGDTAPLVPNTTDEGKATNRRVEFVRTST